MGKPIVTSNALYDQTSIGWTGPERERFPAVVVALDYMIGEESESINISICVDDARRLAQDILTALRYHDAGMPDETLISFLPGHIPRPELN